MSPRPTRPHILLLTGVPGIGKTTVIRKVAARLAPTGLRGFYTEEIREHGPRLGFRLVSFTGAEGVIAHIDFEHRHRVGRYGVDVAAIDRLAEPALQIDEGAAVYFVDEIGKMECMSARVVAALESLFQSGRPIVATIAHKGIGFIRDAKQRPDAVLWEVTLTNRDTLPGQVLEWLAGDG
jgi:nucleoside-triphosphatase